MKKLKFDRINPFSDYNLDIAMAENERKLPLPKFPAGTEVIDIRYDNEWHELSWLAEHPFSFAGYNTKSIASALNGLKIKKLKKQIKVFGLSGTEAQRATKNSFHWLYFLKLYLDKESINRFNYFNYTIFVGALFDKMAEQNPDFVEKLISTENKQLTCSELFKSRFSDVLSDYEFLYQLYRIRGDYKKENLEVL